jgi:hypothetical protein
MKTLDLDRMIQSLMHKPIQLVKWLSALSLATLQLSGCMSGGDDTPTQLHLHVVKRNEQGAWIPAPRQRLETLKFIGHMGIDYSRFVAAGFPNSSFPGAETFVSDENGLIVVDLTGFEFMEIPGDSVPSDCFRQVCEQWESDICMRYSGQCSSSPVAIAQGEYWVHANVRTPEGRIHSTNNGWYMNTNGVNYPEILNKESIEFVTELRRNEQGTEEEVSVRVIHAIVSSQ